LSDELTLLCRKKASSVRCDPEAKHEPRERTSASPRPRIDREDPADVLLIHLVEGETVTRILLARRFTINPVLVILSLVFWYWMWGVPGAILSTPMLAITKIICDRIRPLMAFGHFMEG
jgi:AI-2E family transporter